MLFILTGAIQNDPELHVARKCTSIYGSTYMCIYSVITKLGKIAFGIHEMYINPNKKSTTFFYT